MSVYPYDNAWTLAKTRILAVCLGECGLGYSNTGVKHEKHEEISKHKTDTAGCKSKTACGTEPANRHLETSQSGGESAWV